MTVLPRRSFSARSFPFSSGRVKSGALSWIFMAFSRVQSKSDGCNAGELVRPVLRKILHWRISHAGRLLVALLACVPATALLSAAQEDSRPQITPGERKVPRKKDAGPR